MTAKEMTEKRFKVLEHNGNDYVFDTEKALNFGNPNIDLIELLGDSLDADEIVDLLNALHEENTRLKKAETLANHRGEIISFANALIEDLGSQTMKEMFNEFKDKKYKEWRNLDDCKTIYC